jgi:hypothetical protein
MTRRQRLCLATTAMMLFVGFAVVQSAPAKKAAPPAPGYRVNEKDFGGHVRGTLRVHRDKTTWDLTITDISSDNYPAYAAIEIDISARPDRTVRSGNTSGGKSVRWTGETHHAGTRGARLKIYRDEPNQRDQGGEVLYVDER